MYTTQLMLKYDFNLNIDFEKSLHKNIEIEIVDYSEYIKFITLSFKKENNKDNEKLFEYYRDKFILMLKNLNIYISVFYDSISANRHKDISNSIYELERNFRNLIELVFLNEANKKIIELPIYKRIEAKSKKENREEVVQALQNPLDDLDFIALSKFVNENITLDNSGIIIEQLNCLLENLVYLPSKSDKSDELIEKIENDIEDIKVRLANKKNQKLSASKIFNHLTNKINMEWEELYKIRNLWAHNNCIITRDEYEKYIKLSKKVERKLYTELTLLTFFDDNTSTNKIIDDENIKLTINKFDITGRENCRLEFIIDEENKSFVLEKDLFTYKDFDKFFDVLGCKDLIEFNKNPLILFGKNSNQFEIFKSKIKGLSIDKMKEIEKYLTDIKISEIKGNATKLAKEISDNLECIFGEHKANS
ncbi:hypothetical protein QTH45_04975 [Clostridium perfringens]|nr:hypothetical protein [Clostridium perfringens]